MAGTNLASTSSTETRYFLLVLALLVLLLLILLSHRVHRRYLCSHHRQSDNKALEICSLHISIDALGWVEVGWGDDMIFGSSWGSCFHVSYIYLRRGDRHIIHMRSWSYDKSCYFWKPNWNCHDIWYAASACLLYRMKVFESTTMDIKNFRQS